MSFHRDLGTPDGVAPDPVGRLSGTREQREAARSSVLGTGTLACPECDAPVALGGPVRPADPLGCPYCRHTGAVREFLSLAAPSRPARVEVRVVAVSPPARSAGRTPRGRGR